MDNSLLETLELLRLRLNSDSTKSPEPISENAGSTLKRYNYMASHSEFGRDCVYAKKFKDIFLRYDYEEIKTLFLDSLEQFRLIEGQSFGKGK